MSDDEARLQVLTHEECLELLRSGGVGRIAFDVDEFPVIFPVNYRLVETSGRVWIALTDATRQCHRERTQQRGVPDRRDRPRRHQGWSVLARGTLHAVDPDAADFRERFDPHPWIEAERDAWLIVDPFVLTGRRLHGARPGWAFTDGAYL